MQKDHFDSERERRSPEAVRSTGTIVVLFKSDRFIAEFDFAVSQTPRKVIAEKLNVSPPAISMTVKWRNSIEAELSAGTNVKRHFNFLPPYWFFLLWV